MEQSEEITVEQLLESNDIQPLGNKLRFLVATMIQSFKPKDCDSIISIVDSMPIVTCKGKNRKGKVATEITSKGYCSTKNMYYYGLKLHMVGQRREGAIPFPEIVVLSSAAENDLTVFKNECVPYLAGKTILADKIYSDFSFFGDSNPVKVLTPHKEIKGETEVIRQREKAARDLFSQAVSKVRQPIESFFNWLNEKTEIQRASKVRATKGLLVHTFGKLAIALLTYINL
ncbi:MAG: transposase [Odoribacter splanchnicus]